MPLIELCKKQATTAKESEATAREHERHWRLLATDLPSLIYQTAPLCPHSLLTPRLPLPDGATLSSLLHHPPHLAQELLYGFLSGGLTCRGKQAPPTVRMYQRRGSALQTLFSENAPFVS